MIKRPLCLLCLIFMVVIWGMQISGLSENRQSRENAVVSSYLQEHSQVVRIYGQIYRRSSDQSAYNLKNSYLQVQSQVIPLKNVKVYMKEAAHFPVGSSVVMTGKLQEIPKAGNPGQFDSVLYYQTQNIFWRMVNAHGEVKELPLWSYREILANLRDKLFVSLETAGNTYAPVYEAMLLGDKSNLDENVKDRYQMAGLLHMLAISGVKTLKLDIPLVPETSINWAFVPLHIAIIYILKLCLDEEIIPRCRFPCSRGYFKKCINWQNKKSFSVSQSYRKSLKNQQKEKKPMAYKKYREMKVYEASGYQYKRTPSIVLKGQWLSELGFDIGDQIEVKCEDGRLIITKANEIWQCE